MPVPVVEAVAEDFRRRRRQPDDRDHHRGDQADDQHAIPNFHIHGIRASLGLGAAMREERVADGVWLLRGDLRGG